MYRTVSRAVLAALVTVLTAGVGTLSAQTKSVELTEPDATFPEAFSLIRGIRELPDGRVMVADPLGQTLAVLDMGRGVADTIGRPGQGPREYRQPDGLFPLPGDSTLLVDLGNGRLTALGPNGDFGETMPIGQGDARSGPRGFTIILPRGVDQQGRLYYQAMGMGMRDSAPVLRYDRRTSDVDTIVRVALEGQSRSESGGANNRNVRVRSVPLSPQDSWAVAPDGRVAVARAGDYHVEWIGTDGSVVRGSPVPYTPVRVRSADKEEWLAQSGNGLRVSVEMENGQRRMSFARGGRGAPRPDASDYEWPDVKPPFVGGGVWVTPEGEMWVERSVSAGDPATLDVFDARANHKATVTLPKGRRIAGFGWGTVYLVQTDEDDLQWLERYRRNAT